MTEVIESTISYQYCTLANDPDLQMPCSVEQMPNHYYPLLGPKAERVAELAQFKIVQIRVDIHHLESHEQQLQQLVDVYISNLAPVNRLSDEVLGIIFQEVFVSDEGSAGWIWTLSRACKRWRDVIVGNTSFWSHVSLASLSFIPDIDSVEAQCRRVDLQLKRAGGRSLHVELGITSVTHATLEDLVPMVNTTVHRLVENFPRSSSLIFIEDHQPLPNPTH